jgi:hypothetical protein
MRVPNRTKFQPFAQGLFCGVHGFDGYFLARVGILSYKLAHLLRANCRGGLDIAVSKHVWIRAIQADYFCSELEMCRGTARISFGSARASSGGAGENRALILSRSSMKSLVPQRFPNRQYTHRPD